MQLVRCIVEADYDMRQKRLNIFQEGQTLLAFQQRATGTLLTLVTNVTKAGAGWI